MSTLADTEGRAGTRTRERIPGPMTCDESKRDDLVFMARHHETLAGAAARLGLTEECVDKFLRRKYPELLELLKANERANRD